MKSQADEILNHLQSGKTITQRTAASHYRCWRLAARVHDLREDGYMIATTIVRHVNKRTGRNTHYAVYSLEES